MNRSRQYYLAALLFGLLFHGTVVSFTLENTYDAYVHMFFAEHYAGSWFETWNYKWYTGFTMTSYPPLVHQIIALCSKIFSLKAGFIIWTLVMVLLFVRGVYHFSLIWVDKLSASYAALLAVVSSSFVEALHVFGQLPSMTGIALLLNACPELYRWIKEEDSFRFYTGAATLSAVTAAHHVTTIFGMVFFVAPVLGVAVLDKCIVDQGGIENVSLKDFFQKVFKLFPKAIKIGLTVIFITAIVLFPYWYWSKTDPIAQVSIPHGSRANFLLEPNLGLVFFLIPWGLMLFFLPGIFYRMYKKRNLLLGLSFSLAFVLGTGGTTPIPKAMLGETAFNILTLDRFTIWATVMALPFFGSLLCSFYEGDLSKHITAKLGARLHGLFKFFIVVALLLSTAMIINISKFKPIQPDQIEPKPISNFLNRDGHDDWRYLTLGFGDQVAWIGAHTDALSVDGNYHSARRLPELTTRAVERLENAKYLGMEGLGALQQFLGVPEKYHLKYVLNNDKFYEPLLFFYGWTKLSSLENNIDVWERKDVLPLPSILPKKAIPKYQSIMWGTLPLTCLLIAFLLNFYGRRQRRAPVPTPDYSTRWKYKYTFYIGWFVLIGGITMFLFYKTLQSRNPHKNPEQLLTAYFDHLDFKDFEDAFMLFDADDRGSLEQYLLELSLEDGLLASYAKLDKLDIEKKPLEQRDVYQVKAHWITSVKVYETDHVFELIEKDKQWYIKREAYEKTTPPDQFFRLGEVNFNNQGRRKATTDNTIREDILDRPEIYINQANLVKKDKHYSIVGDLINVDNDPAFITIDAFLYDDEGNEIISYSVTDQIIHNLMPKESTAFRIDFEDIFWQKTKSEFPEKFDPEVEGKFELDINPDNFVINVRSMVTDEQHYKFYGVEHELIDQTVSGDIVNYGNHEMAIPQIIVAQRERDQVLWVDTHYMPRGIRPQRNKNFAVELENLSEIILVKKGNDKNLLVNSISRKSMIRSVPQSFTLSRNTQSYQIYLNSLVNFKN